MKRTVSAGFKLAGKIIAGLCVLALALVPAIVINKIYGYLLALFIVMLLFLSFIAMLITRRGIRVNANGESIVKRRGEEADVDLVIENRSFLAAARAEANVYISDLFGEVDVRRKSTFTLPARDTLSLGFGADMSHIGVYSVGIDGVRLYDGTGLFHTDVPASGSYSVCIMPWIRSIREMRSMEHVTAQAETNTRVIAFGGMDYTGVREYVPGDPMKQIHWKLSAHTDTYMTKLQENNRQQEFAVILDFASISYDSGETLMDVNDTLIETALSLVNDIAAVDTSCRLIYCARGRNIRHITPSGRSNDLEMIRDFIPIEDKPNAAFPDACSIMQEEKKEQARSTNIIVVTSRPESELLQELISAAMQNRSPELYVVVPRGWNEREIEDYMSPVRVMDEYDIPYYIIPTDLDRSGYTREGGDS